jgi:hypothetical protein
MTCTPRMIVAWLAGMLVDWGLVGRGSAWHVRLRSRLAFLAVSCVDIWR